MLIRAMITEHLTDLYGPVIHQPEKEAHLQAGIRAIATLVEDRLRSPPINQWITNRQQGLRSSEKISHLYNKVVNDADVKKYENNLIGHLLINQAEFNSCEEQAAVHILQNEKYSSTPILICWLFHPLCVLGEKKFQVIDHLLNQLPPSVCAETLLLTYQNSRSGIQFYGTCCHHLLRMLFYPNYEIPEPVSVESVEYGLFTCIKQAEHHQNRQRIIDLLLDPSLNTPLLPIQRYVDDPLRFRRYICDALLNIPFGDWDQKGASLVRFLNQSTEPLLVVRILQSARCDLETPRIAHGLERAMSAKSNDERHIQSNSLLRHLPLPKQLLGELLKIPIFSMRNDKLSFTKQDPPHTVRLNLTSKKVICSDDLIIGGKRERSTRLDVYPPHILAAFNRISEELLWTHRFPFLVDFQISPGGLAVTGIIVREDQSQKGILYLLNPENGILQDTIELPGIPSDGSLGNIQKDGSCIFSCSHGNHFKIFIGTIQNHSWTTRTSFQSSLPPIHIGPYALIGHSLISPNGYQKQLGPSFNSVIFSNGLLITQLNLAKGFELHIEDSDISLWKEPRIIHVETDTLEILGATKQNRIVCYRNNQSIAFIDLSNGELSHAPHSTIFPPHASLIGDEGELWTWDIFTKRLWKHATTKSIDIGLLQSETVPTFVLESKGTLYFN